MEERLRECERRGVEASSEIQQAARKVLEENKRLRALLNDRGVADESIDAFLHAHRDTVASLLENALATDPSRSSSAQDLEQMLSPTDPSYASHPFQSASGSAQTSQGLSEPLTSPHYPYAASQADASNSYAYATASVATTSSSVAMGAGIPATMGGYSSSAYLSTRSVADPNSQYYYNYGSGSSSSAAQAAAQTTTYGQVSYTPTYSSYTPTTTSEYSYMEGEEGEEVENAADVAGSSQQYWSRHSRR